MIHGTDIAAAHDGDDAEELMMTCPNGHPNSAAWVRCGECGAPLGARGLLDRARRPRSWLVLLGAGAALTLCGVVVAAELTGPGDSGDETTMRAATGQWWQSARHDVDELQSALDDTDRAMQRWDAAGFRAACEHMHDVAAVDVPARLPAPDPTVNAELTAAAEDAHDASHMCLAVLGRSPNNYDAEFAATTEQAENHVRAVQRLVGQTLTA